MSKSPSVPSDNMPKPIDPAVDFEASGSSFIQPMGDRIEPIDNQPEMTCSFCEDLARAVHQFAADTSSKEKSHPLGDWEGYLNRKHCSACQTVVRRMAAARRPNQEMFDLHCRLRITKFPFPDCYAIQADELPDLYNNRYPDLELVPCKKLTVDHPYGMQMDPLQIDFSRVRLWLQYCDEMHKDSCLAPAHWQSTHPANSLILIDVQEKRLTQVSTAMARTYVALSYVWGCIPDVLELTLGNFKDLCIPGALNQSDNASRLPRTITDAMTVCAEIDVRYLWVDRLCIMQDSVDHLNEQLLQMASIYAESYCCIIAMDGRDANYGLPGTSHSSPRSSKFQQVLFNFSPNLCMIEAPRPEDHEGKLPWQTRGWTFQERALSPRHLVFGRDTVYWACRDSICYESLSGEPEGCRPFDRRYQNYSRSIPFTLEIDQWPDMNQYFNLVQEYNKRNLTFESDALNAFSAIITAMTPSFPGGFIFGIPSFLFDCGLLWSRSSSLVQRNGFPSWSWTGWSGEVELRYAFGRSWCPHQSELDGFMHAELFPLVEFKLTYLDSKDMYTVDNSYSVYTKQRNWTDEPLPTDWTRRSHQLGHDNVTEFTHPKYPGKVFAYPFPVSLPTLKFPLNSPPSYLKFQSKSYQFRLGRCHEEYPKTGCLNVDLEDEGGQWVGLIESLFSDRDQYTIGDSCEVIALSHGFVNRWSIRDGLQPLPEMSNADCINGLDKYEFYNVMWIEQLEGVSYRKAVGRVWKEAWERQNLTDLDVLLG